MAGEFLPEARQKLSETKAPCYLAVIGKVAWFEAGDGRVIKYIRPEEVAVVDESVQNLWKAEVTEVV
jgi:RPA family protein